MRKHTAIALVLVAVAGVAAMGGCDVILGLQRAELYAIDGGGGTTTGTTASTQGSGGAEVCMPGSTAACYSGPMGTEDAGTCKEGTSICKADGSGYGTCEGEVTPAPADNCATGVDANCDGKRCGEAVWSYDFQGPNAQHIGGIATDASGNIYLAGTLSGSITFGTHTLVSSGATATDAFVAKLDSSGNFLWGSSYGDAADAQGATAVAVDSSGNVVLAGWFYGSITFGTKKLTASTTNLEIYVAKLNPMGQPLWAVAYGDSSTNQQVANGVGVDGTGNVFVTGYFTGSIAFGTTNMTASGTQDLFVAELDATTGAASWSAHTGLPGWTSSGNSIAVDANGNAFVAGASQGAFIERLASDGTQSWASSWGDSSSSAASVALDGVDNVYVTGTGNDIATQGHTFVMKFDVLGDQQWAVGAVALAGHAIAADAAGDSFVAGSLNDSANLQPAFLWKLNPDGTSAWTRAYGTQAGIGSQDCQAVAVPTPSFVVVACENSYTMDFGALAGPVTATGLMGGVNSLNIALAKIAAQ
jgi:Beta-propeller repeat